MKMTQLYFDVATALKTHGSLTVAELCEILDCGVKNVRRGAQSYLKWSWLTKTNNRPTQYALTPLGQQMLDAGHAKYYEQKIQPRRRRPYVRAAPRAAKASPSKYCAGTPNSIFQLGAAMGCV